MAPPASSSVVVKTVSESTIVPSSPVERRTHFLSNLDLIFDNQQFYAQIVFLFRDAIPNADNASVASAIASLKSSASRVLDAFPLLAGRLTKIEPYNRTAVDVSGAGIPFFEARCDAKLGDWEELRHCDIDLLLNPKNEGIKDLLQAPLMRLQATVFADGGLALGFSAMHILVDGANLIDLMKAWGEIHRGVPIAKPPRFATELLAAREPPEVKMPLPDNLSFFEEDADLIFEAISSTRKKLAKHTFLLSPESVDALVAEVGSGSYAPARVSSYEAVSALFWSCITRARAGDGNTGVTHFTIPVSLTRAGRIDPPLPEGYFGNAVIMTLASSTTDSIAQEHMSFAARLVHDKAQGYVPELAKSVIDQLEIRLRQGKSLGISIGEGPPSGRDVLSTSLSSFPVYQIEFSWGRLDQCIFSFPLDIGEGLISTLPAPEGGRGRHVAICLQEQHLVKLMEDPIFSKYVQF